MLESSHKLTNQPKTGDYDMMTKSDILDTMTKFVNQRPGLEFDLYGDRSLYQRDYRQHCQKPKQDFEALARAVEWRDSITAAHMREGFRRAFGGRLYLHETNGYAGEVPGSYRGAITYTPGQYGAVEYRHAACDVLARVLWDYWGSDTPEGKTPREHITRNARRELGRGIAARYFD